MFTFLIYIYIYKNIIRNNFFSSWSSWWLTPSEKDSISRIWFEEYNSSKTYKAWDTVSYSWYYWIIQEEMSWAFVSSKAKILEKVEVVDNLTSTDTDKALSANQGKMLKDIIGTLTILDTTDKTSIVNAINELKLLIDGIDITEVISDTTDTSTTLTYSIDRIKTLIQQSKDELINWASGAYDTLQELASELQNNDTDITNILTQQAKRVAVNQSQVFTQAEKQQARDNIDLWNVDNTSDLDKPISTATQTALNSKQPAGTYNTIIWTDNDINTSGATIIDYINVTDGVIQSMGSRTLTPSNIGAFSSSGGNISWNTSLSTSRFSVGTTSTYNNVAVRIQSGAISGVVDNNSADRFITCVNSSGTGKFKVSCNGDVESATNSYTGISDIRYKRDIIDIDIDIADFQKLRPVKYNYKKDPKEFRARYGFIAQEVRRVIPNITRYDYNTVEKKRQAIDEDGKLVYDKNNQPVYETYEEKIPELDENNNPVFDKDGNPVYQKTYGIVYSDIQAINTSMIQKLINQNKEQKKIIDELSERISILEKKVL